MNNSNKPFRSKSPFSRAYSNPSGQAVAKYMNQQRLQSTTANSLSKGIRQGLRQNMSGDRNKTRAMLAGANISGGGLQTARTATASAVRSRVNPNMNYSPMKKIGFGTSTGSRLLVGASAMAGIAIMRGGMNQAHDIMMERYMRDSRYSSRLLTQTNMGSASGNSSLSMGNHAGLSLALSKTRHGH